jgi:hypothetical protein
MITPTAIAQKPQPVRAPFRLLAGFICLAFSVVVLGTVYMAWRRGIQLPTDFIVWLPGMVWLTRLAFHATVSGTVPENENWPFASGRVANCYFLVTILYLAFTTP